MNTVQQNPTELSERRKADREKMAEAVRALAVECGMQAEIEHCSYEPRSVEVRITAPRGVRVNVRFRGDSPQAEPDTYVLSWYTELDSKAKFAAGFANSRNEFHFQKATDVVQGFRLLQVILQVRFESLRDGRAFQPEAA